MEMGRAVPRQSQSKPARRRRITMLFMFYFFAVLCCTTCVDCDVTTSDETTMPTTVDPDIYDNFTLSPSIEVDYTLEVSTSGPAVLDSVMTFTAYLFVNPNHTLPEGQFLFRWINTADRSSVDETKGHHVTTLHKTFTSTGEDKHPGTFWMTVVVHPLEHPKQILHTSSIEFKLTERLNGNLNYTQHLEYQRSRSTFAIDRPIHFHVNITDHFSNSFPHMYTYYWFNGSKLLGETDNPAYICSISEPSVLHLRVEASVQFYADPDPLMIPAPLQDIDDKMGTFLDKLLFTESLSNCSMTRMDSTTEDYSLKLGNDLILNITCAGSFPSAVCWNVTQMNATQMNATWNACRPVDESANNTDFVNTTHHQVTVKIEGKGWRTVHLAVYNDVSFSSISQNYYVYDSDDVNIPALVFPAVFISLGLVVVVIGAVYIVRLRRKMHVEVADFDFDPSISVRRTRRLSAFMPAVKRFVRQFRQRTTRQPEQAAFNRSHPMYDSL